MLTRTDLYDVVVPMLIAFAGSAISGHFLIPELVKLKAQQTERDDGPESHKKKTGTPNMGGLMILLGFALACIIFAVRDPEVLPILFMTLGFGIVGFADDFIKVTKHRSEGLTVRQKMIFQIVIAIVFGIMIEMIYHIPLDMKMPFIEGVMINFGLLSFPVLIFIAVATVNGTNFTDGVDGLSSCVTVAVCVFYVLASLIAGSGARAAAGAMIGALLGFLLYNANPARVFMGDTGSLALGGFVVGISYVLQLPLFIPIVGFIYMIEVISVIIQVLYFKRTHGKRFFKMAPIHHHFELSGWTEVRVVALFTIVSVVLGAVALLGVW